MTSISNRLRQGNGARAGVALIALGLLAGCATAPSVTTAASSSSAAASPSASASSTPSSSVAACNQRQSYKPVPAASSTYVQQIKSRGYLLVGVSSDTWLLGAVNPADPTQFSGFDIEMARLVATGIFGSATEKNLRFKVINTAARTTQLSTDVDPANNAAGGVDLVARAFSMTCARWQTVAFSAEYFTAYQALLVSKTSGVKSMADLKGKTVCAPKGSTSLSRITANYPGVMTVGVALHTDCLVLLQQAKVDAVTGDNSILAGFTSQDPQSVVVVDPALKQAGSEPYGLGVPLAHKDFAAFVNSVLAKAIADGAWQAAYKSSGLESALGAATPPKPQYGRT